MALNNIQTTINYGHACSTPAVPGEPALAIDNLRYRYPGALHPVLEGICLEVQPGEKIALVGPNGAGKSTLIKLIAGLVAPPTGSITIYGNPAGACHHRVAYVPQRSDVDWRFPVSVRQVVMMGRYAHLGWLKRPRPEDHTAVTRALAAMQITPLADRQIGELSGGQQQRVMLARSLAQDADLFLLDEPLNNLDMPTQELIFHVLEQLAQASKTVLVSTHDLGILPIHFSRAIFLDGHVIADGPVGSVLTAETLARAYGVHLCTEDTVNPTLAALAGK
ncbi:MAG: metal ABC transporter ATP-binding protein [Anaerolineae bacterium]|nr:metal ABC transporter ATP-binding protein [Anaerolineae bacterium]